MPRNWSAVEWEDGRLSEVRKSELINCNADELLSVGKTVEVLVRDKLKGNRTYKGIIKAVGTKAEMVKYVNSRVTAPAKEEVHVLSSKRVSKKSSRYADFEELDTKRRKEDDDDYEGDDDEIDDDMDSELQDMADVCTMKKTTKEPKLKKVQNKKSKSACDKNQKISKAEKKRTVQRAAITAQKKQAEAMFASYSKIKANPVMSTGPANIIEVEDVEESCQRLVEDPPVSRRLTLKDSDSAAAMDYSELVPDDKSAYTSNEESSEEMELVQEREDIQMQIKKLQQKLVHIENGNKHVQPAWKHGTSNVWDKSPPTQTEKKYNRPLKPHVENGASMTDRQDQAADYRPKKGLFINKIRYQTEVPVNQAEYNNEMINWQNSGVYVNELQIMNIIRRCKGKSADFTVKKLMDGFFNPWDVGNLSAIMLLQLDGTTGKIMCALQSFAMSYLKMNGAAFVQAVNSKCATLRRTCKRLKEN